MPSTIEKIKKQMQLFMPDEQIIKINHEIDKIKKKNIRKGSIERINRKYTLLNQLRAMKNVLITENN